MSETLLTNFLSLAKLTWSKCSLRPKSRCLRRPQRGSLTGRMKGDSPISCPRPKVCSTDSHLIFVCVDAFQVPHPGLVGGPPISEGSLPRVTKNRVNSQARRPRHHHRTPPHNPHDLALRTVQGAEARRWMRGPPARMAGKTNRRPRRHPHLPLASNAPRRQHEHEHERAGARAGGRASPAAYLGAGGRAHDRYPLPPRRVHDPPGHQVPKGRSRQRLRVSGPVRPGTRRREAQGRRPWRELRERA